MARSEARDLFADLMAEIDRNSQRVERRKVRADPKANKLTRLMGEGRTAAYRYWDAGENEQGERVTYCCTTRRNLAGYFLVWRQREKLDNGRWTYRRDRWGAWKVRRRAREECAHRAELVKAERARTPLKASHKHRSRMPSAVFNPSLRPRAATNSYSAI